MTRVPVVPDGLVVRAVWVPAGGGPAGSRSARAVAYVAERRRRRLALLIPLPGLALVVLGLVRGDAAAPGADLVLVTGLVLGAGYHRGGRGGFYAVTDDGLGEYLGQAAPDLSGLRRLRARSR